MEELPLTLPVLVLGSILMEDLQELLPTALLGTGHGVDFPHKDFLLD